MEENEEKGFVVKDRRKISLEEDAPQPAAEPSQEPMEAEARRRASRTPPGALRGAAIEGVFPFPRSPSPPSFFLSALRRWSILVTSRTLKRRAHGLICPWPSRS